jgi:hypothetical protein
MVGNQSLHQIADALGISFYTVWCIKMGKYDTKEKLQQQIESTDNFTVETYGCWLTGGEYKNDHKRNKKSRK